MRWGAPATEAQKLTSQSSCMVQPVEVRKAILSDKQAMLTSFRPMFGDYDYLPLVIDEWLKPSPEQETWVACKGGPGGMLIAMAQADELEPGDWYLGGLRSNPEANPHEVAVAILGLVRAIRDELRAHGAETVRYGTLADFHESLRLASLLGFREHFRLGHAWHPVPETASAPEGIKVTVPDDPRRLLDCFKASSSVKPVHGYYFTWWNTRPLRESDLLKAGQDGLLFEATRNRDVIGAAMCWHVPWQEFLVFSIIHGTDEALEALYASAVASAHTLNCKAVGLVHPSLGELNRRQRLFGLEVCGAETVQLTRELGSRGSSVRTAQ